MYLLRLLLQKRQQETVVMPRLRRALRSFLSASSQLVSRVSLSWIIRRKVKRSSIWLRMTFCESSNDTTIGHMWVFLCSSLRGYRCLTIPQAVKEKGGDRGWVPVSNDISEYWMLFLTNLLSPGSLGKSHPSVLCHQHPTPASHLWMTHKTKYRRSHQHFLRHMVFPRGELLSCHA